jgi:hypothetical protein
VADDEVEQGFHAFCGALGVGRSSLLSGGGSGAR